MKKSVIAVMSIMLIFGESVASNFFEDRYRGWLWFEERSQRQAEELEGGKEEITPKAAKEEIEQFSRELEELRYVMLARPTVENVRVYREKEKQMWEKAEILYTAWDMANLLYPEQRDLINNPVNVHAVKLKRQLVYEEEREKIKEFAKQYSLVLFFSSRCDYCQKFSPVLRYFGEQYGFKIEAVSIDNSEHEYFKTVKAFELIQRVGIKGFPTVIAVSNDSRQAFELIRGYVSISELEEYSLLAIKYLKEKE